MNKWLNVVGVIFLIFLVLILWTNFINPCPPPHTIFVVDTIKTDTLNK